ncbi:hypothetical protein DFH94DRAFT_783878 [Russula ochroleuca]|uniref:Uncharacterized protein n=1 Tax=Russula ochroleuca TaxID=152965 RepID=A0A9P5MKQ3_9AGAM|nr:hypothetical protein DFH94DRAFT_783878 [Russula ochroleuca]
MSASPPPGLFKPAQQGHSLAILVLIENSATMIGRWPDLRDHYLPTLLGTVRKVNPVVPIQVIFLPNCPISASDDAYSHSSSSRLNHLPEVRFSQQPNNKITAATLYNAADILSNTLVETSTTRHLFVIAASGPSESADVPSLPSADPQPSWQVLCSKLTKENIHLHMILNPKIQESEKFTQLFYEILAMQHFQEAATWFPTNAEDYHFHLSMRTQGHQEGTSRLFPSTAPQHTPVGIAGTASARIPLPRLNSFPPAGANGRPTPRSTAISSTNNSPPSPATSIPPNSDTELKPGLVKHLQKVHGLTKKRNYGLQTSRAPFIRDETAASPYPPTHSVDPANGRPRRNTGVHASKNKKGDDPRRPRRGSVHVGFPESARVSSPDSDSSTSAPSPTGTVAGVLASPAGGPVPVGLQMAMPVSSPPQHNLAEAAYGAVPPPPLWQNETLVQAQAAASANPAPAFTDMLPPQQLASQAHVLAPAQVQAQVQAQAQAQAQAQQARANVRAVAPLASSSYSNLPHGNPDAPVTYSTTAASAVGSSYVPQQSALHTNPSAIAPVPAAAPTTDDGDKPFIFYPEYEDALMPQAPLFAPLSAATQPTPMTQFWPTASADYAQILNPAATPGLLRGNPTPVYDMSAYDSHVHPQPVHSHVSSHVQPGVVYASEQSSSLQSWADY